MGTLRTGGKKNRGVQRGEGKRWENRRFKKGRETQEKVRKEGKERRDEK